MSVATGTSLIQPERGLLGQTVVVIGGSSGIGLETARRARTQEAKLILAALTGGTYDIDGDQQLVEA